MTTMDNSNTAAMSKEVKLVKVLGPAKEKNEKSIITSRRTDRTGPRHVLNRSINALQGRDVTSKTAQAVLFVGKVVVLEALRRVGHTNLYGLHRPLLWTLQGLSGLNCLATIPAPPFIWLQRWAPIRFLARATEGFAKPILFLSVAGLVTNAHKRRESRRSGLRRNEVPRRDSGQKTVVVLPNTVPAEDIAVGDFRADEVGKIGEIRDQDILVSERQTLTVEVLKEELDKNNVALPEWFDDDEVQRFWTAAHGDTAKFVKTVRKTIGWRQRYQFLSQDDLKVWKHLVFWHKNDAHGRPTLIIRLGLAYTTLTPSERPLFAQAIVSQVEHQLRNKMPKDDPRLTVVMDCRGTSAIGFPLNLIKSCSVLVQENYPTRLAALFIINLPPIVQVLANAVLQVIKPSTKEKVHMEGDRYMIKLAAYLGGIFTVPVVLGGKCSCDYCEDVSTQKKEGNIPLLTLNAHNGIEELRVRNMSLEEKALCIRQSTYESYSGTLRVVITGLFLLWLVVAMISGYGDPHVFLS